MVFSYIKRLYIMIEGFNKKQLFHKRKSYLPLINQLSTKMWVDSSLVSTRLNVAFMHLQINI